MQESTTPTAVFMELTNSTHRNVNSLPGPGPNKTVEETDTLWKKWQDGYRKPSPFVANFSSYGGAAYFWFTAVTELWLLVQHALPAVFSDYSSHGLYYLRVLSWFIFLETIANWMCAYFMDTSLKESEDNPTPEQCAKDPSAVINGFNDWNSNNSGGYEKNEAPWKYCKSCDLPQPYRSHHCPLCRKCILKRDHHCYFTGTCIGFYNQRFFIMLNFYIILASIWGVYVFKLYLPQVYESHSWTSYFPPVSTWLWYKGELPFPALIAIFQMNTLWWTGLASVGFFFWHIFLVVPSGKTTYEVTTNAKVRSTASVSSHFKSVFGVMWPVNFIFPAVLIFKQVGNGRSWNNLKFY